ncbi:MAG: 50S ribosomal protein L24 [Candidatus Methylomirabilales bacterium]
MVLRHGLPVRKNDHVAVIAGKDRGKRGKVIRVIPKTGRVIVERINVVKRHTRPSKPGQQGGVLEKEAPLPVSNIMVVCGKCDRPVRMSHSFLADGRKVRVCKKCGESID